METETMPDKRDAVEHWAEIGGHVLADAGLKSLVVPWMGVLLNTPAMTDERLTSSTELLVALVLDGIITPTTKAIAQVARLNDLEALEALESLESLGLARRHPTVDGTLWEDLRWKRKV